MSTVEPRPSPPVFDVCLPDQVWAIIQAAGYDEAAPFKIEPAMGTIISALAWIAAALFQEMTEDQYRYFREIVKLQLADARKVIGATNPPSALKTYVNRARQTFGEPPVDEVMPP